MAFEDRNVSAVMASGTQTVLEPYVISRLEAVAFDPLLANLKIELSAKIDSTCSSLMTQLRAWVTTEKHPEQFETYYLVIYLLTKRGAHAKIIRRLSEPASHKLHTLESPCNSEKRNHFEVVKKQE